MQLTIRLPDEYGLHIERLVREMGLKKSDVARLAIKEFIASHPSKSEYPFSKVKSLIGVAESGISDLGQNHRKYLVERIRGGQREGDR
jgi:hypothetical protein